MAHLAFRDHAGGVNGVDKRMSGVPAFQLFKELIVVGIGDFRSALFPVKGVVVCDLLHESGSCHIRNIFPETHSISPPE